MHNFYKEPDLCREYNRSYAPKEKDIIYIINKLTKKTINTLLITPTKNAPTI